MSINPVRIERSNCSSRIRNSEVIINITVKYSVLKSPKSYFRLLNYFFAKKDKEKEEEEKRRRVFLFGKEKKSNFTLVKKIMR